MRSAGVSVLENEPQLGRVQPLLDDICELFVFTQFHAKADGFPQPFPISLVLKIAVVQERLHCGVGGGKSKLAGACSQLNSRSHPDADRLHPPTTTNEPEP